MDRTDEEDEGEPNQNLLNTNSTTLPHIWPINISSAANADTWDTRVKGTCPYKVVQEIKVGDIVPSQLTLAHSRRGRRHAEKEMRQHTIAAQRDWKSRGSLA